MILENKLKKTTTWLEEFKHPSPSFQQRLSSIYGGSSFLLGERRKSFSRLLARSVALFGERGVLLLRIPGRVNLMGVHIEHRGGYVNYLTIQKEIIVAASPRGDNLIKGFNLNEEFSPFSFSIGKLLPYEKRGNWLKFISESKITPGAWENYIKGAVSRLQDYFPRKNLLGMDFVIDGNIPSGCGLSSSSALIVGTMLATIVFNGLKISRKALTELCGEAEWYVGTRGGAGDHAAMLFGEKGYISHLRFFPLTVEKVLLPSGYTIVMCNSLKKAPKSKEARDAYNQTIASYEIALKLIKRNYPLLAGKIKYLRDVNQENLKVKEGKIYEILKSIPQRVRRKELVGLFSEEEMKKLFSTHSEPKDGYRVRGVALFALAECARGKVAAELLKKGRIKEFGELMYISHNGDRVAFFSQDGKMSLYKNEVTDSYLEQLCKDLKNKREQARILFQPGDSRCSCKELDELVDISKTIPGVIGASLTGAGFGGVILVLVKNTRAKKFLEEIKKRYYQPKRLPFAAEVCIPTDGAGILNYETTD